MLTNKIKNITASIIFMLPLSLIAETAGTSEDTQGGIRSNLAPSGNIVGDNDSDLNKDGIAVESDGTVGHDIADDLKNS